MNAFTHPVTRWLAGLCFFVALMGMQVAKADPEFDPPGRVARLNLAEGAVSVQPQGSKTWSDEVANRPLTTGDRIWADRQARAALRTLAARVEISGETVFFYTHQAATLLQALNAYPGLRTLHRPANLEDLFLKLTGRQIREEG